MRASVTIMTLGAALICGACERRAAAETPAVPSAQAIQQGEEGAFAHPESLRVNLGGGVEAAASPDASAVPLQDVFQEAVQNGGRAESPQASDPAPPALDQTQEIQAPVAIPVAEAAQGKALELSAAPHDGPRLTAALLKRLGAGGASNLLLSPESARIALGMTAEGAPEGAAGALGSLLTPGAQLGGATVKSANALWADRSAQLAPGFVERLKADWGAEALEVDFKDGDAAAGVINAWASDRTEGRVKRLLDRAPPATTELILTNALLFKASWTTAFDAALTFEQPFRSASGESFPVPMMISQSTAVFGSAQGAQAVELPFAGDGVSLLLALPREGGGAEDNLLALEHFARPESRGRGMALRMTKAVLPKLSLEGGADLMEPLAASGFGPLLNAPLERATTAAARVSAVTQKIQVEWDEQGAAAAAATAVTATRSLGLEEEPLRFDRPFYFLILQEGASAPLFAGYVSDPRSGASQ